MWLLFFLACSPQRFEGRDVGDCTDAADNDGDGAFDCDDIGCASSPDCADVSDADADTDTDTDTDADADTDTDTETETETEKPFSLPITPMLAVGDVHNCLLNAEGKLTCWGNDEQDQASPPEQALSRVDAGLWHSCGIAPSGQIQCFGCNGRVGQIDLGQCDPPDAIEFIEISASTYHTCAIDREGSIHCWGCGEPKTATNQGQCSAPEDGIFTTISASTAHSCALDQDGAIHCWGCETLDEGQCEEPEGAFTAIAAAPLHTCALTTEGAVWCWGRDSSGELDVPDGSYIAIATNNIQSCALTTEGEALCWGCGRADDDRGQCDSKANTGYIDIGTGTGHTCASDAMGAVDCWGCGTDWEGDHGQCAPAPAETQRVHE